MGGAPVGDADGMRARKGYRDDSSAREVSLGISRWATSTLCFPHLQGGEDAGRGFSSRFDRLGVLPG